MQGDPGAAGSEDERVDYASDLRPDLVRLLDSLANEFKPPGPAQPIRIELHYDGGTGDFVSAHTTLKTTRRMLLGGS